MKISIKNQSHDTAELSLILQRYILSHSRFTAEVFIIGKTVIKIKNIRLVEPRKYCGSHPNACELPGAPMRKAKYLEGADWVDFNDMINDILDALAVDANVATAVCKVRKNRRRRTYYGSHLRGHFWQWNMDEEDDCYEDFIHRPASNSNYPFGTPGVYERNNEWTVEINRLRWAHGGPDQRVESSIVKYVAMNPEDLYWSNIDGWVSSADDADTFDELEISLFNLPLDGRWVPLKEKAS
jgi:hypothetical protein